jgi:hypothetical protein
MVEKKSSWTISYPRHAHAGRYIIRIFEIAVRVIEGNAMEKYEKRKADRCLLRSAFIG